MLGLFGGCVAASDGCDGAGGLAGDVKRGIVNASAGYLEATSGGLAEDIFYDESFVDTRSGAFFAGNFVGTLATVPFEFNPAGAFYNRSTTAVNAAVDCTQELRSGDCGAAVFATSVDFIGGRIARLGPAAVNPGRVLTGDGFAADLGANYGSNLSHLKDFNFGNDVLNFITPYTAGIPFVANTAANTAPSRTGQQRTSSTPNYSFVCC